MKKFDWIDYIYILLLLVIFIIGTCSKIEVKAQIALVMGYFALVRTFGK